VLDAIPAQSLRATTRSRLVDLVDELTDVESRQVTDLRARANELPALVPPPTRSDEPKGTWRLPSHLCGVDSGVTRRSSTVRRVQVSRSQVAG
jgi:hypothetical protein